MAADPGQWESSRVTALCRALASPVRLEIVRYIGGHPGCIGVQILVNLPGGAPRAQSTLSQHLRILCDAGIVEASADGAATAYTLSDDALAWLTERLRAIGGS